ncbi:MAG: NAD-dependent epimerase/dehydratase family protein [Proteobacteria bacterium]|nr:NAD-dependent epimerase/dehydratase family protein [Pseudomonadota bacterium]
MGLNGTRVAVTGATGFVGGALAERLIADGAQVVLAGRRVAERVPQLVSAGGIPIDFDLTDPTSFGQMLEGVEVLFHVAAWVDTTSESLAEPLNVHAVEAIVKAAATAGVTRVVHVSTVAVYDLTARQEYDETLPICIDQPDVYGSTKARGEELAFATALASGVELTAIRPAMVYGPGSPGWTVGMYKLVSSGTPCIFGAGDGLCYPLYIDNLIDALVAAGTAEGVNGEAIHLADGSATWRAWFEHFGQMCGRQPRSLPMPVARLVAFAAEKLPLGLPLNRMRLAITQNRLRFDTTKAERLLGWTPAVDLEEGMRRSEAWLRSIGRIR